MKQAELLRCVHMLPSAQIARAPDRYLRGDHRAKPRVSDEPSRRMAPASSESSIQRPVETAAPIHVLPVLSLGGPLDIAQVTTTMILALGAVESTEAHHLHQHLVLGHVCAKQELLHLFLVLRGFA